MSSVSKSKVLICGATGFIGRNLVEAFAGTGAYEVHAVRYSRPEYDCPGVIWHQADLRRVEEVERVTVGMDIIIQAAATTSGVKDIVSRPHIHVTDNAVMNSLLLRAAYDHHVRHFVFLSCSVMLPSREAPQREEDWNPATPIHSNYFGVGHTKVYIECMCEFYARLGRTRHTVIRHSNVYGPYDKFDLERGHVFGATVAKVMTAESKIVVWGSGEEIRDLLHVDDLVAFVRAALDRQKTPFEIYHAGGGTGISVRDLVREIVLASGRALVVEYDLTKPTIKTNVVLNCDKARRELGWGAEILLRRGIRLTLDWWQSHYRR